MLLSLLVAARCVVNVPMSYWVLCNEAVFNMTPSTY